MSNLVATSVTYTINNQRRLGNSKVANRVTLAFGNGSLAYITGGVPITSGSMGCPNTIESCVIADAGTSGYTFNYNTGSGKLQLYTDATHNHNLLLNNAVIASAATNAVMGGTTGLGANTGSNITITGGLTTGGIQNVQPSFSTTELPNGTAPAALTLIVEVIGW